MAQTLTEIKTLLAEHGLHPRHRFGQNFLHDANHMKRIITAAEIAPGDLVLEVGPGTGALSEWLVDAGARLVMVEIDRDLEPILRDQIVTSHSDRVELVIADILASKHEINPAALDALARMSSSAPSQASNLTTHAFKLIANLPYNVASPLLLNLVIDHPAMSLAVVMIQREVADRLLAKPGGKDYGPLGILIQAMCEVDRIGTLSPSCFWPAPQVESSVVRLRRRATPMTRAPRRLAELVHTLFSKRRKQIGSILGRDVALPPGICPQARPEQLSIEQLIALAG